MKKLSYLVLICSIFLGIGCEKDSPFFDANSIVGSWSLSEANLGWGGYETYESNQIVWKFGTDQQLKVTVKEGLSVNQNIPFSNSQLGVRRSCHQTQQQHPAWRPHVWQDGDALFPPSAKMADDNKSASDPHTYDRH